MSVSSFEANFTSMIMKFREPNRAYYLALLGDLLMFVGLLLYMTPLHYYEYHFLYQLYVTFTMARSLFVMGLSLYLYLSPWSRKTIVDVLAIFAFILFAYESLFIFRSIIGIIASFVILILGTANYVSNKKSLQLMPQKLNSPQEITPNEPTFIEQIDEIELEDPLSELEKKIKNGDFNKEQAISEMKLVVRNLLEELKLRYELGEFTPEEYRQKIEEIKKRSKNLLNMIQSSLP
ncbi:MAG: hypothetical protein ACP6IP_07950 [Candidatus Njordarchaeia archaeon]